MRKIEVKQKENAAEVPTEVIAQSIEVISAAMKKLASTRLTRKAIITLLHDDTKLGKYQIELVLNSLDLLEQKWLKKKP